MKIFIGTFLVGLTVVGLFNFTIDPTQRWHRSRMEALFNFDQNWGQEEVCLTPENYDERLFVLSHLKVFPKPDVLIMGSSRCMIIDSHMFNGSLSVFNAGMSGASVQDYIAVWQSLLNQKKVPHFLLLFLDPWVFNKNNGQSRWLTNSALYTEFLGQRVLPFRYYLKRWKRIILNIADLMTYAITKQSFLIWWQGVPKTGVVKIYEMPQDAFGKRSDGSFVYPKKNLQSPRLEEIREKAVRYVMGDVYSLSNWAFDERSYRELVRLLQDIHRHGTKTLIVLPPYQHLVFDKLQELPHYRSILSMVVNTVSERLSKESDIHFDFCNALNPVEDGCAETEFMDGHHMLRPCAEKVLRKCLGDFDRDLNYSPFSG